MVFSVRPFLSYPDASFLQYRPTLELVSRLVVHRVSSRWDHVGLQLGMTPERLKVIEREQFMKMEDCCIAMFREWLQGAPGTGIKKRSWEVVLCAVESGHGTTAEEEIRKGLKEVVTQLDYRAADFGDKVKTVHLDVSIYIYSCTYVTLLHVRVYGSGITSLDKPSN